MSKLSEHISLDEIKNEIREKNIEKARRLIKSRVQELDAMERVLKRARKQVLDLLDMDADDVCDRITNKESNTTKYLPNNEFGTIDQNCWEIVDD